MNAKERILMREAIYARYKAPYGHIKIYMERTQKDVEDALQRQEISEKARDAILNVLRGIHAIPNV